MSNGREEYIKAHKLKNTDKTLKFFYDETNNARTVTLKSAKLNIDVNDIFALGGVVIEQNKQIRGWAELRRGLFIQDNAKEVKLKHLAKGEFNKVILSKKIGQLFDFLIDNNYLIHYSVIDLLHWSILDIIESLQGHKSFYYINSCHQEIKSELHYAATKNLPEFLKIFNKYSYPNIADEQVSNFLSDILTYVENVVPEDRNLATTYLKKTLKAAINLDGIELMFLKGNKDSILIDDFIVYFINNVRLFKNSSHYFDQEPQIESYIENYKLLDKHNVNYAFVDSKSEIGIQLSDVVIGIIGKYFSFITKHTFNELIQFKKGFSAEQLTNLNKFKSILLNSNEFSSAFLHHLLTAENIIKSKAFLCDDEVPEFFYKS